MTAPPTAIWPGVRAIVISSRDGAPPEVAISVTSSPSVETGSAGDPGAEVGSDPGVGGRGRFCSSTRQAPVPVAAMAIASTIFV
jgi:hypothetical protein